MKDRREKKLTERSARERFEKEFGHGDPHGSEDQEDAPEEDLLRDDREEDREAE